MTTTETLPIIDISPFIATLTGRTNDTDSIRQQKITVGKQMDHACREFGFLYLTGHGLSDDEMREIRDTARQFFMLPLEEKEQISIVKSDRARGYQQLGQNVTKYQKDWHEAIDLYAPVSEDHPIHKHTPPENHTLKGSNPFPTNPPEFQSKIEHYVATCRKIGEATMRAMAAGLLGIDQEHFFDNLNKDSFWVLRLIGYPPLSEGKLKDGEVGMSCGEHTDYGCLTILNQDNVPGALQVLARSGNWISADPIPGAFVINIGDMVNVWTNDVYKATLHRVIHTAGTYRVSVPFFFEPNFDTIVKPLDKCVAESGGVPKHKEVMYGHHLWGKVTNNFTM